MKTLLLHIGPHKTASTYVQTNLVHNDAALRARGVCYPEALRGKPGHHLLPGALGAPDDARLAALAAEAAPFPTVILSSETLTRLEPEQIGRLLDLFPDHAPRVLFFHRGPHELWPSQWQETVKHGGCESWPDFMLRALGLTERVYPRHLRPAVVLDRWTRAAGREAVRIFPYACIGDDPLGALRPVCALAGIEPETLALVQHGRNAAYAPERIEAIRALNRRAVLSGEPQGDANRRRYLKRAQAVEASDAFAELAAHLAAHGRRSVLRPTDPFIAQATGRLLRVHGDLLMRPVPEPGPDDARTVTFLDATHPVPDALADRLADALDAGR